LLAFVEVEPDGTTRRHAAYLTALYQYFGRERIVDGEQTLEYVAGEATLMGLLADDQPGLARLERLLIEQGLVDRTPRGRRCPSNPIVCARRWVSPGPSSSHSSARTLVDGVGQAERLSSRVGHRPHAAATPT
jgi:hypothetical protein